MDRRAPEPSPSSPLSRRAFLAGATLALTAAAAACSDGGADASSRGATTTVPVASTTAAPPPTAATTTVPPGAQFVAAGPHTDDRVALTFHTNGDLDLAAQLLAVLAARHVHMTSFIVGDWLDANPDWAKKLVDGGHELANHTYTHPTFGSLSPDQMTAEITRCRDVLTRLTGSGGRLFRPSGTDDGTTAPAEIVLELAGEAGYPVVLGFNVDPLDYDDPGADLVVQRTLATVTRAILSLHFGHPGTIQALPAILDGLEQRHLEPVTASTLLAGAASSPLPGIASRRDAAG